MKFYQTLTIIFVVMLALMGCATTNKNPQVIEGNIPESSPFAKIRIGMSQRQIHDILGFPTDSANHTTGKMFIPFYFGNDTMRFYEYYKGMGNITYTGVGIGGVI